jgi:cell division protein FtsB
MIDSRWVLPLAAWVAAACEALAGHKSRKVTLRYMHFTETALRETMRLLEDREAPAARAANDTSSTSSGEVTAR